MITIAELRAKRITAGIAGQILCKKLGISRSRLSDIERGYVLLSADELSRMCVALDELIKAKLTIQQSAERVGWPAAAVC